MKRIGRVVAGFALILAGMALLVLPGPGILTILAGLILVGSEFKWAANIVIWAKEKAARVRRIDGSRPSGTDDQTG